ncbi:MAG: hypothetical protein ACE5JI_21520 [Acidobacteriota bacterium]
MTTTRDRVAYILDSGEAMSVAELGRRVGVTRERARQVCEELDRDPPPKPSHKHTCTQCGVRLSNPTSKLCQECYYPSPWLKLTCEHCGDTFLRSNWEHRRRRCRGLQAVYCSKRCTGVAVGTHYGFGNGKIPSGYIALNALAARAGIVYQATVYHLHAGRFPGARRFPRRHGFIWGIPVAEAEAWLKERGRATTP